MPGVRLEGVSKRFDQVLAVDTMHLEVKPGEFLSLLGPSGCGKTTTLRMVAGYELPDTGAVYLGDEDITYRPAHKRNVGMVFQNYALFPHMTVRDNIAFGLEMRKMPKAEIKKKVKRALELVRLPGLEERYPKQLSGGQQQRVALARALVIEPDLLLLDEPLSNLDAKLRVEMRVELKMIQREVGITTIFVTHDQEEALTLSDRMVVMNQGLIIQVGSPFEIYEHPKDCFVAGFLGQENFFSSTVRESNTNEVIVQTEQGLLMQAAPNPTIQPGDSVIVVARKERIDIASVEAPSKVNSFPAKVDFVTYLGTTISYLCSIDGKKVLVTRQNEAGRPIYAAGDTVRLEWEPDDCLCIAAVSRQQTLAVAAVERTAPVATG